jgi:glycosyltransferase involved in cell wall biosynthesis
MPVNNPGGQLEQPPSGKSPLVTIFMPVYNRKKYLPEALDSLLGQTFTDYELIIADDGSSDGSLQVAQDYAKRDPRIRVLKLAHGGEVKARNEALRLANPGTKYLLNHDSDDISLPTLLASLVETLEMHPEIAIVGCFNECFRDGNSETVVYPREHEPQRIRATYGQLNSMVNSASLIRREVYQKIGGYRQAYAGVDDYDFYARALEAGFELANLPQVLHRTRLHTGSVTSTRRHHNKLMHEIASADYYYFDQVKQQHRFPLLPFLETVRRKLNARWEYGLHSPFYLNFKYYLGRLRGMVIKN